MLVQKGSPESILTRAQLRDDNAISKILTKKQGADSFKESLIQSGTPARWSAEATTEIEPLIIHPWCQQQYKEVTSSGIAPSFEA